MAIPEFTAKTTDKPDNRFISRLYLRVTNEGTLVPLDRKKRKLAHYIVTLTIEYPNYQDEIKIKQQSTKYDESHNLHFIDFDVLTEERVRKCLVSWDLHEKIPNLTCKLHRIHGLLEDDSMEAWMKLPPLVRKAIGSVINSSIGPV